MTEPPQLGNWFPSYQYESPKLDTSDNFGDSIYEESDFGKEKEECLRGFKEMGKKNEILVGPKLNSNGFSECSLSVGDDEAENQSLSEVFYLFFIFFGLWGFQLVITL